MKHSSVDIAYEKLLADLRAYGAKKETEEACKAYAEKKRKDEQVTRKEQAELKTAKQRAISSNRNHGNDHSGLSK